MGHIRSIPKSVWYQPAMPDGTPFSVKVACWGWLWSLQGYSPSPVPLPGFVSDLALRAWASVRDKNHSRTYPTFVPQTGLVNYYRPTSRLGLHRDRQEEEVLLMHGSPIVTVALGASCRFQVRDDREKLHTFTMQNGDALVMFGAARLAEHGVKDIIPNSSPRPTLTGRFSVTIRQVHRLGAHPIN